MQDAETESDGRDFILDLNFVPEWARQPPGEETQRFKDAEHRERPKIERKERRRHIARKKDASRSQRPRDVSERTKERHVKEAAPSVTIHFIPDQKQLAVIVRRIHASKRAYPVIEAASLFVSNPNVCMAKIENQHDSNNQMLLQCRSCGAVACSNDGFIEHVLCHVDEYFECREEEVAAPAGKFVCVARCGLSGILLGPPNHHSYAEKVQEVHSIRYKHISLEEYQSRIEILRDPELIEQWKKDAARQRRYYAKGAESDVPMNWIDVEAIMAKDIAPKLMRRVKRVVMPVSVIGKIPETGFRSLVEDAWQHELRYPASLSFALRVAFKHKRLHLFRAGSRGHYFVTAVRPMPLNSEYVIDSIREVLMYLREKPGCNRDELVSGLRPGETVTSEAGKKVLAPLGWLIERGHIIEFYNGTLSVPLARSRT
ncbi:MAG: hypothetical protein JXN60_04900 [Lentisphaerae bacterium]|nr:hypothetical protein [Lentisphaerota bacterium]